MPYIELHSKSAFSFLEGASIPEALAGVCAERGLPAMALLDRDGVYGAPRFHHAAGKTGIRALLGSEITIRSPRSRGDAETRRTKFLIFNSAIRQFGSSAIAPSCLRAFVVKSFFTCLCSSPTAP